MLKRTCWKTKVVGPDIPRRGGDDRQSSRNDEAGQRVSVLTRAWCAPRRAQYRRDTDLNRPRSPHYCRQHGSLLEKAGYMYTQFSKPLGSHLRSIDMDDCAPFRVVVSGHDHWHEECGVHKGRRGSASGLIGAINLMTFGPTNGGGATKGGAPGSAAHVTGCGSKGKRRL